MHDAAYYMQAALAEAEQGLYTTTPNPRVGCVIVAANGDIIGRGFTQPAGQNHAEIQALQDAQQAGHNVRGATVYVTLEPCAHYGRTPPCCDALIHAGVGKVISALRDPNPLVAGQGLARLSAAGISVEEGLLTEQASTLNRGFLQRMRHGKPWVRLKIAASLDGKTALSNGESQWITGPAARQDAHHWRAQSCAVLTGIGTVLADNPQLNVRAVSTPRQPLRIVLDHQLRTPLNAAIAQGGNTLIVCAHHADPARQAALTAQGCEILRLDAPNIALPALLNILAQRGLNELLVEAGSQLNGAFLAADCVDELLLYLAPKLLGDSARGMANLAELNSLQAAKTWQFSAPQLIGDDLRISAQRQP